jgi:hypothetical protein
LRLSWNDWSRFFEVGVHLRHYTSRLQRSQRLRYRIARYFAIWLPLLFFLYALVFLVGARG